MHGVSHVTPGILLTICVGLVVFMVIYRLLFKSKR